MYGDNRNARRMTCQARFMGATSSVLRGDIIDVSNTGICLSLDSALDRGRELHLEFELPAGRVEAVGEVRWTVERNAKVTDDGRELGRKVELGIRFVRISSESLAVIAEATQPKLGGGWASQFSLRR